VLHPHGENLGVLCQQTLSHLTRHAHRSDRSAM
jgi:hypothetical protein